MFLSWAADASSIATLVIALYLIGKLRDAFVLIDIDGLTAREAAKLLGVSHNTMRSRHILARGEFKRLWERTQLREERSDD